MIKKEDITPELTEQARQNLTRAMHLMTLHLKSGYLSDDEEEEMKQITQWAKDHQLEEDEHENNN